MARKLLLVGLAIGFALLPGRAAAQQNEPPERSPAEREAAFFSQRAGRAGIPPGAYLNALA